VNVNAPPGSTRVNGLATFVTAICGVAIVTSSNAFADGLPPTDASPIAKDSSSVCNPACVVSASIVGDFTIFAAVNEIKHLDVVEPGFPSVTAVDGVNTYCPSAAPVPDATNAIANETPTHPFPGPPAPAGSAIPVPVADNCMTPGSGAVQSPELVPVVLPQLGISLIAVNVIDVAIVD
jgi:hypothetical protein